LRTSILINLRLVNKLDCSKLLSDWYSGFHKSGYMTPGCDPVMMWWCDNVLIYWCDDVLIWWCDNVLIYWCVDLLIWIFEVKLRILRIRRRKHCRIRSAKGMINICIGLWCRGFARFVFPFLAIDLVLQNGRLFFWKCRRLGLCLWWIFLS